MGFFDNLLEKVGRSQGQATGRDGVPLGPLNLSAGDFVLHYKERLAVVGVRSLDGDGAKVLHYCLKGQDGGRAVLVAEEGPDSFYSLQRPVAGDVRADADVLTDIADEPFHVVQRGRMRVRSWGDCGVSPTVRQVEYREYEDPAGERVLVVEDYQGVREVRVGVPVFATELEFERGSAPAGKSSGPRGAVVPNAKGFEEQSIDSIVKGSPRAAAEALERHSGAEAATSVRPDEEPTGYGDDEWGDSDSSSQPARPTRFAHRPRRAELEADEWSGSSSTTREDDTGEA